MKIVICLFLIFASSAVGQNSVPERLSALEATQKADHDNQNNYNHDEHERLVQQINNNSTQIKLSLDEIKIGQQQQLQNIQTLNDYSGQIKLLGVIFVFSAPTAAGLFYFLSTKKSTKDKAEEDKIDKKREEDKVKIDKEQQELEDKITLLQDFRIRTELQIPLLTEIGDRLSTVLIEGVHHPDEKHGAADDLLDKLKKEPPPISHDDNKELTGLMSERSKDSSVSLREQNMAKELMPVVELLRRLKEIQKVNK